MSKLLLIALFMIQASLISMGAWATQSPALQTTAQAPAVATPPQAVTTPPAAIKAANPPLRQANSTDPTPTSSVIMALQQKHKQELSQQLARLAVLEQANQTALASNQALQLKNDSLAVQVQVLQSERSAQMFLYGAVTFGVGVVFGTILYSVIYTRRRQW